MEKSDGNCIFANRKINFLKKGKNMEYKAVKYNSKEEAMAAFIKMRNRKREWLKKTEAELQQLRTETSHRYGFS